MRKNLAILSILATSLMSYSAMAQDEAAPAPEGAAPAPAAEPDAAPAPAPAAEPAIAAAPAAASESKFQVGVAFLPMLIGRGTVTTPLSSASVTGDLKFAYGVGLTAGYAVIPGLSVGIAPQFIFNVKGEDATGDAAKEIDLMARIAYAYHVIPNLAVYAEVLPGYSIFSVPNLPSGQGSPKGFVIAGGVGGAYDITDMFFANLGVGYQMGFQTYSYGGKSYDDKTRFLRLAVGGGVRF
ncbi:MAG: hypothetical protein WCG85_05495 [Polyangia bacterium]